MGILDASRSTGRAAKNVATTIFHTMYDGAAFVFAKFVQVAGIIRHFYKDGILDAYDATSGNNAINLRTQINNDSSGAFKHFLRVIAGPYLFGTVLSILAISLKWIGHLPDQFASLAFEEKTNFGESDKWPDDIFKYTFGLPGMIIGGIVGSGIALAISTGRVFYESMITSSWLAKKMMNLVSDHPLEESNSNNLKKKGFLGYPIGAFIGLIGIGIISTVRFLSNTAKSAAWTVTKIINPVLPDPEIKDPYPKRLNHLKALGFLGYPVGAVIGTIGAIFISGGRFIVNTYISSKWIASKLMSTVLPGDGIEEQDKGRPDHLKALGVIGYPIGAVVGTVFAVFIGAGRIITNTCKTAIHIAKQMMFKTNELFPEHPSYMANLAKYSTQEDRRSNTIKILSFLGYGIGAIVGAIGSIGIVLDQIIPNTMKSLRWTAAHMMTSVLHKDDAGIFKDDIIDNRPGHLKAIGGIGYTAGALIGMGGVISICIGRFFTNTLKSGAWLASKMMNVVLDDSKIEGADYHRDSSLKVLGGLGYPVGFVFGFIGSFFISFGRTASNTMKSAIWTSSRMMNVVLGDEKIQERFKERPKHLKALGVFGYPIGVVIGVIGSVFICIARTIENTAITTIGTAAAIMNLVLPKDIPLPPDTREAHIKAIGAVGYMLGAVIGTIAAGFISAVRITHNSIKTCLEISGGIWNVALGRQVFDGLKNERKGNSRWTWGLPGVILALPSFVAGATVWSIRVPLVVCIGFSLSPFVAAKRIIKEGYKKSRGKFRFDKQRISDAVINDIFKSLFSSLTAMGNLPEGKKLLSSDKNPSERSWKNLLKFIRKSITLDDQTLTEETLSTMHKKLSDPTVIDINKAIDQASNDVKAVYKNDSHFITAESAKREKDAEVDKVTSYVKEMITERASKVVPVLYQHNNTSNLFFSDHAVVGVPTGDVPKGYTK